MELATITAIRGELEAALKGRRFGNIFQLSKTDIAVDFRLAEGRYLFVSIAARDPRVYLIKRKLRELEKLSGSPSAFSLLLRKKLSGAELSSIGQIDNERILLFNFDSTDDLGTPGAYTLVAQLTGASANLFLLDSESTILDCAKETLGDGQQAGQKYEPPTRTRPEVSPARSAAGFTTTGSDLSAQLDAADLEKSAAADFQSLANAARAKVRQEISKREKLIGKLEEDLTGHGEPDKWKRFGDLLLANSASARRDGDKAFVTDYYDEAAPEISILIDENDSITEAAEKFFRRYTKARNARQEIEKRKAAVGKELQRFLTLRDKLETAIDAGDVDRISEIGGRPAQKGKTREKKRDETLSGVRRFVSSDGLEILVGKKAKDNDFLTFRIAKSLDTWMHAADYPGSHVVIRNPNRKDIPHGTLLEAAQLAAFYSQGKSQPKAAVHYTQKKFVNKPKGSAPGLVSLASFKTVLVEPKIGEARKNDEL